MRNTLDPLVLWQHGPRNGHRWGGGVLHDRLLLSALRKCWQTDHTGDLSLTMFSVLGAGVALWIVYGLMKSDVIIIFANAVSLALLLGILYFKLREKAGRK
jgi:MtN3 and saliva related transmembrane protein